MSDLKTEFLCNVVAYVDWQHVIDLGVTPHGIRQIIYIKGGTFAGPKVNGVVLPGGGDWFVRRADQVVELDVRCVLRTDDNHLIYCCLRGINEMTAEVAIRTVSGESTDSPKYYFRVTTVLETGSPKYDWLNRIIRGWCRKSDASGCRVQDLHSPIKSNKFNLAQGKQPTFNSNAACLAVICPTPHGLAPLSLLCFSGFNVAISFMGDICTEHLGVTKP